MYTPFKEWNLKFGVQQTDVLPGEKKLARTAQVSAAESGFLSAVYHRCSSMTMVRRVVARLVGIAKAKSFCGGRSDHLKPESFKLADCLILKDVQKTMQPDLDKVKGGRYQSLRPQLNDSGIWVVGTRMLRYNPMTPEHEPQQLLPYSHVVTKLLMKEAHEAVGHKGRDRTLAKFRERYWTPNGAKLSWSVKDSCQACKLQDRKPLSQTMGQFPLARLKPHAPPFTRVMIDFFGPYDIRGEVQKRTTGKAYGIVFTDLTMRAVHLETSFGYDTSSFMLALNRFVNLRGWPEVIYSDPGSQLVSASHELKNFWNKIDKGPVQSKSAENGLEWIFGPADSPWHQGAVESMVKLAKRAIHMTVHNQRLSPTEFLTLCTEVANLINERPIGTIPSTDSDISILTPNSLLLGRASAKNPRQWQPEELNHRDRFHLVQQLSNFFWAKWTELCAPALLVQRKWHTSFRNLMPGDVVIVTDRNSLRGDYRLGLVKQVHPGVDGKVRKVSLAYKNFKVGEKVFEYKGAKDTIVTRSVQRLALLVPVDDS
jgi:hypothetical protein